ncbi:hypothetical protein [Croceivirga thetidis]|uniref:Uncharacterized protein n=1 Tax=Croceivirga thetidis TaxID=2721623 RepID=A0ABX1GTZ6_9FLAO|nr:hypothetical protein [Croceivirga thetidis]NKI32516.1 hypothetical protein [Croceivirga thetidis]
MTEKEKSFPLFESNRMSSVVDELFRTAEMKSTDWRQENLGLGKSTII